MHTGGYLDGDDRCNRPINHETEGRPPARVGNKLTPVLPEVLETVTSETDHEEPRCACDRRGGDDDEHAGNTGFDSENGSASVGDRETDIDRGDHHQPERVDGRRIEPPERKRRGRLRGSDDQSPYEGCSQPPAYRLYKSGDAHAAGATLKLNIIPLSWCSAMWQCAIQ